MKMGLSVIISLLFTAPINFANGQQQVFKNYTANDGLVSNSIRRVFQDSKGFLWIGTWEGLSKYDGNTFTNFTRVNGLSHNLVNDFYESPGGRLFVALNNGTVDEIKNEKIVPVRSEERIVANRFFKTPWGKVLVTTDSNGIRPFQNGKFAKALNRSVRKTFSNICMVSDTTFVAAEDHTISIFNKNEEMLSSIQIKDGIYPGPNFFKDSQERIWAFSTSGIQLIQVRAINGTFIPKSLPGSLKFLEKYKINDMYEDDDSVLWFATTTGIIKVNEDETHIVYTVKEGLSSNIITTIFQDRERNIWFGTSVGLSKLVTTSGITLYPIENGVFQNDRNFLMYPFKKDHFLVGTFHGTKDFNKHSGTFSPIFPKDQDDRFYKAVENTKPLIITGGNKSVVLDSLSFLPHAILEFSDPSTARITISDKTGNQFLSNTEGLFLYANNNFQTIYKYRVSATLIDKDGYLWIGTWNKGLIRYRYNVRNQRLQIEGTRQFLPGSNIRSLYEDSRGDIWVGTRYNGLFRITWNMKDSFDILHISQAEGLTSNFIKGISEDAHGNYWIAFFQGLDRLIINKNKFRIFNFSKVANFFTPVIGMDVDENHDLWIATEEGIVKVKDRKFEERKPFSVFVTKIYTTDSTYPTGNKKLLLNFPQKSLQFEFSSPSYINEKQIFYSYRLTGQHDAAWSEPANRHSISYAALPPGNYQFQVKSMGWNGEWGKPALVNFEIIPPFWQTWWFILLAAVAGASLTVWLVRRRIQTIRHEAELRRSIAETEMMALRAQMNPHFIFNCINSIDALIQENDKYHATIYLNKFARLIRNILDSSKQNTVGLTNDLDTLKLYIELEQFRHEDRFIAKIKVDDELLQDDYKIPPLIVQPFVENAIQHGLRNRTDKNGQLLITISKLQDVIQYTIEDNGVGRGFKSDETRKDKTSYGISMSSERVRLFNNEHMPSVKIHDLYFDNRPSGTRVVVRLNIQSC